MNNGEKQSKKLAIKICGITNIENALAVAALKPDMMGFILYSKSKRYVSLGSAKEIIQALPKNIKKVAVVVNSTLDDAIYISNNKHFDYIQLHGNESPEYCQVLSKHINIIKAFGVNHSLPTNLNDYVDYCKYFLFDTKSENFGGTGLKFDHTILQKYHSAIPFIISGGLEHSDIKNITDLHLKNIFGIDVNSKVEQTPGIKDVAKVEKLIKSINHV